MWIQTTRTHDDGRPVVRALKYPWMDDRVEFNENGNANVTEEVARRLLQEREDIVAKNANDDANDGESDANETGDADESGD